MKKTLLLFLVFAGWMSVAQAQRLKFDELEAALQASMDKAQENLFLKGYSLVAIDTVSDKGGKVYTFSNRKKSPATAKKVAKGVYADQPAKSFVQYVTYEAAEFQKLRKLMIEQGFNRSNQDELAEASHYYKDNLEVDFKVETVNGNQVYRMTLRGRRLPAGGKLREKLRLKSIFGN